MDELTDDQIRDEASALTKVLPDIDADSIEAELRKNLERYLLPLKNAKAATVRRFNGSEETVDSLDAMIEESEITHIRDLRVGMDDVNLLCFIADIYSQEITVRGERKVVFKGMLVEDGIPVHFTFWEDYHVACDSCVLIKHMKVGTFQGEIQLSSKSQTKVFPQG